MRSFVHDLSTKSMSNLEPVIDEVRNSDSLYITLEGSRKGSNGSNIEGFDETIAKWTGRQSFSHESRISTSKIERDCM